MQQVQKEILALQVLWEVLLVLQDLLVQTDHRGRQEDQQDLMGLKEKLVLKGQLDHKVFKE